MERISLDLETIAKRELGETPQVKEDAVAQLRALLSEDPVLHCPLDEDFLVKFLRSRKFHVRETLDVIRRYFRVRQEYTDLFDNLLPSRILYDATLHQNQLLTVPKQRDSLGRLIVIFKLGAWNPAVCSLNEFFRLVLVGTDCNLMDPTNQITGIVGVVDLDGLHISHFLYFTPSEIRRTVKIMQHSLDGLTSSPYCKVRSGLDHHSQTSKPKKGLLPTAGQSRLLHKQSSSFSADLRFCEGVA
ncbi:retinaldehyde-binding protein 1 isoform X3 [Ixodes scapularis]|uniref:retinaldehyde-binding protein 1 isoform X3 n=1 Tax=Ixodes scapularis TaxID=6945 RepID=UPI001C3931AA|nr:retinaldehyde-binding protein 1 isoform X3 [Ixodes scapularis]